MNDRVWQVRGRSRTDGTLLANKCCPRLLSLSFDIRSDCEVRENLTEVLTNVTGIAVLLSAVETRPTPAICKYTWPNVVVLSLPHLSSLVM